MREFHHVSHKRLIIIFLSAFFSVQKMLDSILDMICKNVALLLLFAVQNFLFVSGKLNFGKKAAAANPADAAIPDIAPISVRIVH